MDDGDDGAVCALCCWKKDSLLESIVCHLNYCSNSFGEQCLSPILLLQLFENPHTGMNW